MIFYKENNCYTGLKVNLKQVFTFIFLILVFSCDKESETISYLQESDHFILHGTSRVTSQKEIDEVIEKSESLFPQISQFLGEKHEPKSKIHIRLEGDLGSRGSYVDFDGIHLYRYGINEGGYLSVLAHELTHAFIAPWFIEMEAWDWLTYRFFDEGFAEYVAQKTDSLKQGFPFYGYPEHAVVGDLVVNQTSISCDSLRIQHETYNQTCNLQAYPQRTSWIRHIDEVLGRKALFEVIFPDKEPTNAVVDSLIGIDLLELDSMWEAWVVHKYNSIQGAQDIAEAYRERTSWYTLCE